MYAATSLKCDIYRPKGRTDLYVFVQAGAKPEQVVLPLLPQLGPLEFLKTRDVVAGQPLVGTSSEEILRNVTTTGFHVQGVKVRTQVQVSEGGAAIGGGALGASIGGPLGALLGAVIGFTVAGFAKSESDDI